MNFLFYDLETSGLNPGSHRPMQFAAILTDSNLKELKRVNWLVKLNSEILPDPIAILTTGITPQSTQKGMSEPEFLKKLHQELLLPDTVVCGYNSIQFDDEFMRYTLWRNFYDPYEWQWKEERSRFDIITLVRMTRALRPEGIKWPFAEDGMPVNSLELLAKENKLEHRSAHDALSDVEVTIDVTRLIKKNAPKLFSFLLNLRNKKVAESYLDLESPKPVVHTTPKFPQEILQTSVVFPLCPTPGRAGGVLVYDLRYDPTEFLNLNPTQLKHLTYSKKSYLSKVEEKRLPVKMVQFNKCPALAPLEVLTPPAAKRINLDLKQVKLNLEKLKKSMPTFAQKVYEAYKPEDGKFPPKTDPDLQMYDGFLDQSDRILSNALTNAKPREIKSTNFKFNDDRLEKLFKLYKARNFPEQLTEKEKIAWAEHLSSKFENGATGRNSQPSKKEYLKELERLQKTKLNTKKLKLLKELQNWAEQEK
jgi:exodeoxyribonuclease-1